MKRTILFLGVCLALIIFGGCSSDSLVASDVTDPPEPTIEDLEIPGPRGANAKPTQVMVKFRTEATPSDRARLHRKKRLLVERQIPQLDIHAVRIPPGKTAEEVIAKYNKHPLVEFAEAEQFHAPAELIPNDPDYGWAWHLPRIGAPSAWDITTGDSDLVIAILDSGVDGTHPDLAEKIVPGWNTFLDNADWNQPCCGHGTHVAGTAAASSDNGYMIASPAWGCRIMPIRVTNDFGWATDTTISEGLVWAADHGVRVANASFESCFMLQADTVKAALTYFHDRNGVTTFASGNSSHFCDSPDNPHVLRVSATGHDDLVTDWSSTGTDMDLSAPGVDIQLLGDEERISYSGSGTSYSAPIVAGVAALVMSANPALGPAEVQDILKLSADDVGPPGWDPESGWGRVNAAGAVSLALNYQAVPDNTPPYVAIVDPVSEAVLLGLATVIVDASDDSGVSQVDLYCGGEFVSSDTVAPHEWSVDTTQLPNGVHSFMAVAFDAVGNSADSAPVIVMIDNGDPCEQTEQPGLSCADGLDNDCDGATDCDDADCDADTDCAPPCGDGICDFFDDGEDSCNCPRDCGAPPATETDCADAIDEDCDGMADGDDPDCAAVSGCGNGVCEGDGEDCFTCPLDCRCSGKNCRNACCGDGVCDKGEKARSCPVDCG